MNQKRKPAFAGRGAHLQYRVLMALFTLAMTRGLYGRFARGLGRFFDPENAVIVDIGGAAPFRVRLADGYWTRFALRGPPYEPEIARVMAAAESHTDCFVDLGANTGFWTLKAAKLFQRVIAVEAGKKTFRRLRENTDCLARVALHQAAVHACSGRQLRFVTPELSHASARLSEDVQDGAGGSEIVETVSVDDLVPEGTAALIKLDVEGAEVAAFDGAARAFADGAVFIYEDHGGDPTCEPSAWLLSRGGFRLWSIGKMPMEITSTAQLRTLKKDPYKGYNFLVAQDGTPLLSAILDALQSADRIANSEDRFRKDP